MNREHSTPVLEGHLFEADEVANPRAVHENVDCPELAAGLVEGAADALFACHVDRDRDTALIRCGDLGRCVEVTVGDGDLGSLFCQGRADGRAEASTAAGDECGSAFERKH